MNRRFASILLILPLMLFLAVFFAVPLGTVAIQSIYDPVGSEAFPRTAAVIGQWDGKAEPSAPIQTALVEDLRDLKDRELAGDATRRLNSVQSGFRTLLPRTIRTVQSTSGPVVLAQIDERWADVRVWRAIAGSASRYTSRNYLAAIDFGRDEEGNIVKLPAEDSANLTVLARTLYIGLLVTTFCVLIGYPYAMLLAATQGAMRKLLIVAVLLPMWTSLLVRTAAWFILLQERGLINGFLLSIGIIGSPLPLIFNRLGVVIAMVHVLLPFMVLPIYSVLLSMPKNLMPAAASLGAVPWRAFLHVYLPLSMRGVAAGALLVFMTSIGYYITPALIGGPQDQMISSVIAFFAINSANWGMAGAMGCVLLGCTFAFYLLYNRMSANPNGLVR